MLTNHYIAFSHCPGARPYLEDVDDGGRSQPVGGDAEGLQLREAGEGLGKDAGHVVTQAQTLAG